MSYRAWNKGLTKETDERVRKNGESVAKALIGKHPTAETSLKRSETMKKLWKDPVYLEKMKPSRKAFAMAGGEAAHKSGNAYKFPKKCELGREKLHSFPKGNLPWNAGLTKETDDRLISIGEKNKEHLTGSRQSIETIQKRINSRLKTPLARGDDHWMHKRPLPDDFIKKSLRKHDKSSLELKFESIINKYNLPYKFVGNGEFLIGKKCPDFVNEDKKIAIEVYYRNHKDMFRDGGCNGWIKNRTEIFEQNGWKILFFNEIEVNENNILEKLEKKYD